MKHIYGALMRPLLRDYHVYMYVSRSASHVEASSLTVEKGDKEGNNLRRIMKHATGFFIWLRVNVCSHCPRRIYQSMLKLH